MERNLSFGLIQKKETKNMRRKGVLIILENLSISFDRRAWMQAVALRESGRVVSVICPRFKEESSFEICEGINIYRYSSPPPTKSIFSYMFEFLYCFIMTFILSIWVFLKHGFDVIQAGNPPDTFFIIGLYYKLFGKEFYFDHRDLCPEIYLSKYGEKRIDFLYKILFILEYLTYRIADKVIVPNNSYREIAISRGKARPDKVFVMRIAPDLKIFKKVPEDLDLKQGKRFLVLYLGIMASQDGVDYLLYSIDSVVKKYKRDDIRFVLIGNGDSFNDLKGLKEKLCIDGVVFFTGMLKGEKLMQYLSTADICVAPDPSNPLNDKSTMVKVLEYMAMAKPIVSFDLKESRYSAGEAALYAKPNDIQDFADKILELIGDSELRYRMGRIGYERLKGDLSWGHNRETLIDVYDT